MEASEPNNTIYVNNLNEKIKKEQLKRALHGVFSQFGKILDIVACRGKKLRGQAWVVFDELQPATNALRQMQGFPFFDKPMRISFARAKSDVISKRDGTFKPREKRPREEPPAPVPAAPAPGVAENGGDDGPEAKRRQTEAAAAAAAAGPSVPSNTLFAEGLPEDCNEMILGMLFQQYNGYQEVRMVPGKTGIAFVDFETEVQAGIALQGLNGFKLTPTDTMRLSYRR